LKDPLVITLESPAAIIEQDSRRADEIRKRVQQLDTTLTLSTFELGDLFSTIKAENLWNEWKFESFSEYIKASGVDISRRQVDYLVQISNVSKILTVTKTDLAKARISKLKEIYSLDHTLTVTDPATLKEESMADIMRNLVIDAPNRSLAEVKEIVKRLKGPVEDKAGELTWWNWPVRRDAKEVIEATLEKASAVAGQTFDILTGEAKNLSKASALELVCGDWAADPNNQVDEQGEAEDIQDETEDGDENDFEDDEDEDTEDIDVDEADGQ